MTRTAQDRFQEAFGVRPFNFYATTEGLYGHDCPAGSMHLFDDMCIVENVDENGDPVPPGEVGARLLVTNLFNRTQPLIRFEVTDLVVREVGKPLTEAAGYIARLSVRRMPACSSASSSFHSKSFSV